MTALTHLPAPRSERAANALGRSAAVAVLALLGVTVMLLAGHGVDALSHNTASFLTSSVWTPDATGAFGISGLIAGTAITSAIALAIALPAGLAVAATGVLARSRPVAAAARAVDLLAAIPSVVIGLWAVRVLLPRIHPGTPGTVGAGSLVDGGLVLALMVTPVIAAMSREVLLGVDPRLRHSVIALGGSDWDVMLVALWPSARIGLAGAGLLGLARAMGETIALALVVGGTSSHATGSTLAASIVLRFSSAGPAGRDALVAVGLTLFVITVATTGAARTLLRRSTLTRGVV